MASVVAGTPIPSASNWAELEAAGWRWAANVPAFWPDSRSARFADRTLGELQERHGRENVATGNAWRSGAPSGIAKTVGLYSRSGALTKSGRTVDEHLITGTILYVVITCAGCRATWEQPNTPVDDQGWNVCPYCLHAASTRAVQSLRDAA